jgi:outer membrane biosynthesis protein TonB
MAKKTTKPAAKKAAPTKKAPVAKKAAPTKKAPVAKKAAPTKKAPVAKKAAPTKKAPVAKKAAPATKGSTQTSIIARVDVGFGNSLCIRGEGAGLSWTKGALLENVSPYEWAFKTTKAKSGVTFKFAINDEIWAEGENLSVSAGGTSISSPTFG